MQHRHSTTLIAEDCASTEVWTRASHPDCLPGCDREMWGHGTCKRKMINLSL
ncbi:MAG: hypothetical protein OXI87_15005 [Albidovulum sp.]|nr:hypothetical protein [Albidovulum sp.]